MKKFVLLALILCTGSGLFATDVIPYTEVVSFSVRTSGTGGGGTLTVHAEGTVAAGHNVADTSPESTFVFARLRPGRDYVMNFAWDGTGPGDAINSFSLNFIAPAGYDLLIDDVPRDMWGASVGTVSGSHPFTLRIRPQVGNTPDGHSDFSGISLGKAVKWAVGLGSLRTGSGAGGISFRELDLSGSPVSRDRLYLTSDLPGNGQISVIRDGGSNQVIRQVIAPSGAVDLFDEPTGGYSLKFYTWGQFSWNGTLYTFSGSPWKTIRVESPAANQLKITETEGAVSRASHLSLTSGSVASGNYVWTLQEGDGTTVLRTTVHTSTDTGTTRTVIEDIRNGGTSGTIVAKNRYYYKDYDWGEELKEVENGYGLSNSFTTTYGYYTAVTNLGNYRQVKWVTDTTGNWTGYERYSDWDKRGRTKYVFKPWNNLPVAPTLEDGTITDTDGLVEKYTYVADWTGRHSRPSEHTTNVYTVNGNAELGKTTWSHGDITNTGVHEPRETRTATSLSDATASLSSISQNIREDAAGEFMGRPWVVKSPSGHQSSWSYSRGTFNNSTKEFTMGSTGDHWREIKLNGAKASGEGADSQTTFLGQTFETIWLIPYKSTAEVAIRIGIGALYRTETHVYTGTGNWVIVAYTDNSFDGLGRVTQSVASNGATTTYTYGGLNRLISTTDASGVQTDFTSHDSLGRTLISKKVGAAASSPYLEQKDIISTTAYGDNGTNQVITQTVKNWDNSESLVATTVYDLAGRAISSTPPGLGATQTQYAPSLRKVTTVAPDGAETIQIAQLDGRPYSVTGSAVVAKYFTYGFESDGRTWSRVDAGSSSSLRWTKSWADRLGRSIESRNPTFSSVASMGDSVAQHFYDTATGNLNKAINTGYAPTLYKYNALGEMTRSGLNVDTPATDALVPASMDRITDTDTSFEQDANDKWWIKQTTTIYPSNDDDESFPSSIVRTRLTGFTGSLRAETRVIDAEENVSTSTTTVSGKIVTTTSTAPGMINSATVVTYNGLAVASTGHDGLTNYAQYDSLGRPWKSIDPRGLVTTTAYYNGTTLVQTVTDSANKPIQTVAYDTSGRVKSQGDALGAITYTAYNARGGVIRQWGTGTYPVEYEYDATYGDRTKMRTWRVAPGGLDFTNATAFLPANHVYPSTTGDVTAWTNDVATGLVWKKTDAAGGFVEFNYNTRGQIAWRKWARTLTASTEKVKTTYRYYGDESGQFQTGELWKHEYNDDGEAIPTPDVVYTYNRAGQVATVQDGTTVGVETRNFAYQATAPWRLDYEALPAFFDLRRITRLYESSTGVTGSFGGYTKGTVKGRGIGFDLGILNNQARDLHQQYTASNLGRFVGVTGRAASGTAQDFVYDYESGARLLDGYTAGSFKVSRDFESNRDLTSRLEATWSSDSLTRFDFTHNDRYERVRVKQSGKAFADYFRTPASVLETAYSTVDNFYSYNLRGELQTSAMYTGNAASPTPASGDELPGRRFEYRYDEIGNRKTAGPAANPESLINDTYTVNALNQYDSKDNNVVRFFGTKKMAAKMAAPGVTAATKDRTWAADFVPNNDDVPAQGTISIYSALIGGGAGGLDYIQPHPKDWFIPSDEQIMSYDADGNLKTDGVFTYTWNAENQLVRATSTLPTGSGFTRLRLDFKYDYMGRRTEKRVTNLDTSTETLARRFIYDSGSWNLTAELNANTPATILRSYAWGLDLTGDLTQAGGIGALLRMTNYASGNPGTSYYPSYDGNGNVVSWVNATSGDLAAVYEYDPYGNLLRNEVIDSAIADAPFRFSTKYTDVETGWACYGYRYYAAPLGRFVNKDPIAEQGGLNLYGFVGNNGVTRWDYLGLTEADEEYKKAQAAQAAEKAAERRARAEAEDAARRAALRIYGVGGYLLHGGSGNAEVAAAYNNAYAANSQVTGTFTITASALGGNVVSSLSVNITGSYNNVTTALGIAENTANAAIDSDRISQLSSSWSDDSSSGLASGGEDFWAQQTAAGHVTKITSISEVTNPHGKNILNYLAGDKTANDLAQNARAGTGFASLTDRMNNRLVEQGTVQLMTIANGKPVFHLYPDIITSGTGQGYRANFNSLLLGPAEMHSMADSLRVTGPYFALAYHDHGGTGPMSQADADWASRWGATVATNGNTAYIAVGLNRNSSGQMTVQLYEGPVEMLGLK